MRHLRILSQRLRTLFFRRDREAELAREFDLHLEQLTRELIASGLSPAEARLEARRQFGPVDSTLEECRDHRGLGLLEDFWRDLLYALRLFRKSPGFTFTAVASLLLGIGANVAMFQLLDAVRTGSLPVEKPSELVAVRIIGEGRTGNFRGRNSQFTYAIWDELQRRQTALKSVFAYGDVPVNLAPAGEMRNVEGVWVSGSYFPTLGVRPTLGRVLTPDDDRPGCGWPGVVLSHAFWQREFGGSPDVLARTLPVDGQRVPILGVTPPEFFGVEVGRRFDVALPICSAPASSRGNKMFWFLTVRGRLDPGTPMDVARARLRSVAPAIFNATVPPYSPPDQARFTKLQFDLDSGANGGGSEFTQAFEKPIWFLLAMVVFVLLLACANLSSLMLARATAREHEFAVRASLGASRWRLLRQVFIESLLLSVTGATLGALAAPSITRVIVAMLSTQRDPIFLALEPNWRVWCFTIAAAVAATILCGLAPALRAARPQARGSSSTARTLAFRNALLVLQVAFSMMLLTTALLFSRSFRNLTTLSPGFDARGVLVTHVFLDPARYPAERRLAAIDELHSRIAAIPGIANLARSYVVPVGGSSWDANIRANPGDTQFDSNVTSISPGYFQLMKMPLLAGRDFLSTDRPDSPRVAIVNQAFARTLFGDGRNPIGQTFRLDGPEPPIEITGLVGDSKYLSLAEPFKPIVYFAASQERAPRLTLRFLVRPQPGITHASLTGAIKQAILSTDSRLNLRFTVMQSVIEESVLRERLMATLTSAFAFLGIMLALTGVFGVTAYVVSQRFREFGVRMALGAAPRQILILVLRQVALILVAGIVIGSGLALAAGFTASTALFGIKPYDPLTLFTVVATLVTGGLLAGLIPAVRAARIAPVVALRVD